MPSATFWSNTVWYILLGTVTVVEVIFVIIRAKERRLVFAFYLTILGIALSFETVVLIFMKAYTYYPMILKDPPFAFDAILAGNLFSQFSVAATALLVTIFDLGFHWSIFFALLYGIIEEFFLMLGIYSHNWYQTWMTVLCLLLYFGLQKESMGPSSKG